MPLFKYFLHMVHEENVHVLENVGVNSRASRLQVFAEVHPSPFIAPSKIQKHIFFLKLTII